MKYKIVLLVLAAFLTFSFVSLQPNDDKKLKNTLIGTWSGSEKDNQQEGLAKYWIKTHDKNGRFIVLFTAIQNCEVETHIEKGKWEVKDGLLHETFDIDGKTDVYTIEVIDNNIVKYRAKELSVDFNNTDYEFTETREE